MDRKHLEQFLFGYFRLNPKPTDEQFHSLAYSINIDHEALEAIVYEIVGDQVAPTQPTQATAGNPSPSETRLSEQQKVLDGDYDPNVTSPDNLLLNDGAPEGTSNIQESQDALYDDGVGADDTGVGINSDKNQMISDGLPPVNLKAAARLAARLSEQDFDKALATAERLFGKPTSTEGRDGHQTKMATFNHNGHEIFFGYWGDADAEIKVDGKQVFEGDRRIELDLFIKTQLRKMV